MGEPPQRSAKQHAVQAGQHPLNLILELRDKLLHGVSPWVLSCRFGSSTTYTFGGTPANVCVFASRRCGAARASSSRASQKCLVARICGLVRASKTAGI